MELLGFELPNYSRYIFPNLKLKEEWEAKLSKARKLHKELEILSVANNIRDVAFQFVNSNDYEEVTARFKQLGLSVLEIYKTKSEDGFSNTAEVINEVGNEPYMIALAICRQGEEAKLNEFKDAYNKGDDRTRGNLLGYPSCCQEFFIENNKLGYIDPIWQQAQNTPEEFIKLKQDHRILINSNSSKYCSAMTRALGVRLSSHIPCSHSCEHTHSINEKLYNLAKELNLDGIKEMEEVLSLPMEWDCLKGIAYISTPVFKVEYNSVSCLPNYIVQKEGTYFPENAPNGLKFPWTERWRINGSLIHRMKKEGTVK